MICSFCADIADRDVFEAAVTGEAHGHAPAVCRDYGRTPDGCGCQHRPIGTATETTDA